MPLNATPGDAGANSYATLAELTAYAATRPGVPSWFGSASDPQKEAALIMATRMLDGRLVWTGSATDADVQALGWPRTGMLNRNGGSIGTSVLPQGLKDACCEWALQMGTAGTGLADNDPLNQGITSVKAGSVAVTFKETNLDSLESADIAMRLKQVELAWSTVPDAVRQLLVPSWYSVESVARPFMFDFVGC